MSKAKRLKQILTSTLAIAASIAFIQTITTLTSLAIPPRVNSLEELYEIRDRLIAEIEAPPQTPEPTFLSTSFFNARRSAQPSKELLQELRQVEVQILIEHRAKDNWRQALNLGGRAAGVGIISNPTVASRTKEQFLWQQAIKNLQTISPDSLLAEQTGRKLQEYQQSLADATYQLQIAKSTFLEDIRKQSGLSSKATIVVCNLKRECLSLRGDKPPASPASLIKVPIAVALMHKLNEENISIETPIYVSRANFTEDGSEIRVRKRYPLKTIVGQMLDRSSNIASNQLIDYLGRNYINKLLENRGYEVTRVNYKLMGNRIKPKNMGKGRNRITSEELAEMMVQIYNREHPGSDMLIAALANQKDRLLGYAALEDLEEAQWLGEKTGENSKAMGTTLAMSVRGQVYVVAVTDNRGGRDPQIRRSIGAIAEYIISNGAL